MINKWKRGFFLLLGLNGFIIDPAIIIDYGTGR